MQRCLTYLRRPATDLGSDAVSLEQLARLADSSPAELSRAFRQRFGLRPMEVVHMVRLDRSLDLLEQTTLPIAEIATLCGFRGAPHYFKVFWFAFSMSPADYRAAATNGQAARTHSSSLLGLVAQQVLSLRARWAPPLEPSRAASAEPRQP